LIEQDRKKREVTPYFLGSIVLIKPDDGRGEPT
jgi:hypothetical protein